MGIISTLKRAWNGANTAGRINMVLDAICGVGAAAFTGRIFKSMAPDMNRLERICARVTACGVGMAVGEVASKAYAPFVEAGALIIDTAKAKSAKKEEEAANGK